MDGLELIFTAQAITELMNYQPDKIVATAVIEKRLLADNTEAGVVKVQAHAMRNGQSTPLATVDGCPKPPCNTN